MVSCPCCERRVDRLYALPPAVITRELVQAVDGDETPLDIKTCENCRNELLAGQSVV